LDLTGLKSRIMDGAASIAMGRRCLMLDGREREGRVLYQEGIAAVFECFKEALATRDPAVIILSEQTYVEQELEACDPNDKDTYGSLTAATQGFDDALRSLEVVRAPAVYREAAKTYSTIPKNRVDGCPNDVFHQACGGHATRLRNSLRTPGVNMTEKAVANQRIANMTAAQAAYLALQRAALAL